MFKATIVQTSSPNPLGEGFELWPGLENQGELVRFKVTSDKLQMVSMRELSQTKSEGRTEEVRNAWPVTNVDLKYRVNYDGETTNFYEENQELDWQVRQWVKVNFARSDSGDLAPFWFVKDLVNNCIDQGGVTSTLVPGSFKVDEPNDYMEWTSNVTLPLRWDDETCYYAYGSNGQNAQRLGRTSVTLNIKYSLHRALPMSAVTYKPQEIPEKDPIRHKYGPIQMTTITRDTETSQLAARQLTMRFDPQKPLHTWYFSPDFPKEYKKFFTDPNGIKDQTNALFEKAGAKLRFEFKDYNDVPEGESPREYGDVRYSFLRWITDQDMQGAWAGVTQFVADPRTGETLSASISFNDFPIKDYYVQRIDAYLKTIGACAKFDAATETCVEDVNSESWTDPGSCTEGQTMPIAKAAVANNHNGNSSLFLKMQQYLGKPDALYGKLGPKDFIRKQDDDFFRAYYTLAPYHTFGDPAANQFVIPEGGSGVYGGSDGIWKMMQKEAQFTKLLGRIDRGEAPYDAAGPQGLEHATKFLTDLRELTLNHKNYEYRRQFIGPNRFKDSPSAFSFETVISRDARHCIKDPKTGAARWETKDEWVTNLINTYWSQVAWHEFGHAVGLEHNFMASVDKRHFPLSKYKNADGSPKYALYANSVMEYNAAPDRVFWEPGWAPYDQGAIAFIYGNDTRSDAKPGQSITGQVDAQTPWKDPYGFQDDGKTEKPYLFCSHQHLPYTPLCRQGDLGTTPSEIIANQVDAYEWQYKWRNFRSYRKFWDNTYYAYAPLGAIIDMRRFMSAWVFDWSNSEVTDVLRRVGFPKSDPNAPDAQYYNQLTDKFNAEMSSANQMVAAFHKAVIQQSSGERPYRTIYDDYYGDTTQQGIILDKLFAMQGFVGMWPTDNYDQNQAGFYIASYGGIGDSSYNSVSQDVVNSMIGGQYDVYPYFVPLAVAQFSMDTHSPSFSGGPEVRDWIGGHTFWRIEDFLGYFRDMAVQNNYPGCTSYDNCKYDPRDPKISDNHNEFIAPDKRIWIWAYIPDRNQWVVAQKERHTAAYIVVRNYNDDIVYAQDDGDYPGRAYSVQLPLKFYLDSFTYYN